MSVSRVLWIALFRGIGDAVLFYPTLKRSLELLPDSKFTIIAANAGTAETIRLLGFSGDIRVLSSQRAAALFSALWIGIRRFDLVIDASSSQQMHLSRWMAFLLGRRRIGYDYGSSSRLYTDRLSTEPIGRLHQTDIFLRLLDPLGEHRPASLSSPAANDGCLRALNLPDARLPRIVVHPGGRDGLDKFEKRWPAESYKTLLEKLKEKDVAVLVVGSSHEEAWAVAHFGSLAASNFMNLVGKTTIPQIFELVRAATLFIGNNSGPMHIASAAGVPVVTFAGGIPQTRWGPAGSSRNIVLGVDKRCNSCPHYECEKGGLPCLEAVTVDDAWRAVCGQMKWTDA